MDPGAAGVTRRSPVVVLTGVSGSGKSTVGRALAARLDVRYLDGDDLHPPENVAKMRAGVALSDADRWPWLDRVDAWIADRLRAGEGGVVACSALRRSYRARLARNGVVLVLLDADPGALRARLGTRTGHYMPATLLDSQLATLERPGPDEAVLVVEAGGDVEAVVSRVLADVRPGDG